MCPPQAPTCLRHLQAVGDCSAALACDPTYAKAYLRRGELRVRCGDVRRPIQVEPQASGSSFQAATHTR